MICSPTVSKGVQCTIQDLHPMGWRNMYKQWPVSHSTDSSVVQVVQVGVGGFVEGFAYIVCWAEMSI